MYWYFIGLQSLQPLFLFKHTGISTCYHTSLLLTANLLYKAALQEVAAIQESGGSSDETEEHAGFNPNAPHP